MSAIEWLPLEEIRPYEKNPRNNTEAVPKVAESIKQFGFLSPIVVDGDGVILAGHTRYEAARTLGMTEAPVLRAEGLTAEACKAYRLADNKVAEFSRWDAAFLLEELDDLSDFDVDMSEFGFDASEIGRRRASWSRTEKYCDLKRRIKQHAHGDITYVTLYETGKRGIPIKQIKENADNVPLFADNLVDYVVQALGENVSKVGGWALVTTPRRRHKSGLHFATAICQAAANALKLPFYEDAFTAEDRGRIEPTFHMAKNIAERNVILYDDLITTGQTIRGVRELLLGAGLVVYIVIGIMN